MGKLKMLMGMLFLFVLVGMFSSCTSEDENLAALNEEVAVVKTAATAKEQFRNDLQDAFTNVKNGEKPNLSTVQINLLQESAKRMLKADGVYNAECQILEKENKSNLILIGSLYLYMTNQPKNKSRILKTRSSEDTTCFDWTKFESCLTSAVAEYISYNTVKRIITEIATGQCLTKKLVFKITCEVAETIAKRIAPGVIVVGADFALEVGYNVLKCMKN